jgi:hypothetical protein
MGISLTLAIKNISYTFLFDAEHKLCDIKLVSFSFSPNSLILFCLSIARFELPRSFSSDSSHRYREAALRMCSTVSST